MSARAAARPVLFDLFHPRCIRYDGFDGTTPAISMAGTSHNNTHHESSRVALRTAGRLREQSRRSAMVLNRTLVTTKTPVQLTPYLAWHRNGEKPSSTILEFWRGGFLITHRKAMGVGDCRAAARLLANPVYLHYYAAEHDDDSISGVLLAEIPSENRPSPWLPGPLFCNEPERQTAPKFYFLGRIDCEPEIRTPNRDFVREVKAILYALSDTEVTDATERGVDRLLASISTTRVA